MQNAERLTDIPTERRSRSRFPIMAAVRYKVTSPCCVHKSGIGYTVDVSSRGVLFIAPEPLAPGEEIELCINWPVRLDHKVALKLVSRGRVVRCEGSNVAVEFMYHEFRTRTSTGFLPIAYPHAERRNDRRVLPVSQH